MKHQSFITEYLRHRDAYTAYCFAYNVQDCSKYETIMSAANRLMNREDVSSAIKYILDGIRADVEQEIRAELKTELLTVQRKRELLAKIATGEMYVMQHYKGKDCNHCSQHVAPTINQMLKAIDLDSRLAGHYPDTKHHSKQPTTTQHFPSSEELGVGSSQKTQQSEHPNKTVNNIPLPNHEERIPVTPDKGEIHSEEVSLGQRETPQLPVIAVPDQLSHAKSETPNFKKNNTHLLNQESLSHNGGRMLHNLPLAGSSATGEVYARTVINSFILDT